MKKIGFAVILFVSMLAQAQVSVNINIGQRPSWGPEINPTYRYYYMPELDVYYDVRTSEFIYEKNRRWIRKSSLPSKYNRYDLNRVYKVVLNDYYRGNEPYTYHTTHIIKFPKHYNGKPAYNQAIRPNGKPGNHVQNNKPLVVGRPTGNLNQGNAGKNPSGGRNESVNNKSNSNQASHQGQSSRDGGRR